MNPEMIALMVFFLIALAMTGSFILIFPITRRLGQFLEYRMSTKGRIEDQERMDLLLKAVGSLRDDVARLAERQEFTERLLEKPRSPEGPK